MKTNLTFSTMKIWMTLLLVLTLAGWSNAAITVTMATANCSVTGNTIKFDVTATNNSGSTATIDFNSTVIRFTISAAIIPADFQSGDIVFAYDTIDGNSDFPLLWPPYAYPTFSYTVNQRLSGVSAGTGIYTTSSCATTAIPAGGSRTLGTFLIVDTRENWNPSTSVGLTWSTTSSINAYTNCTGSSLGYSSAGNRTLTTPCSLTTLAGCTAPSSATASSDFSTYCAGSTINFSSSVASGDAPFTYVWSGPNSYVSQEDSLISPATTDATGTYTVTVSNGCGSATATTSLTVNANITPSVSIASNLGTTICSGDVIFTATPTNGGNSPSYQWNVNNVNVGTNNATYDYTPANGDVVKCTLAADPTACPSPSTAASNVLNMTVVGNLTPSVSITSNATSNTTCAGVGVTFTATPTNGGSAPSYQWFVNGNVDNSSTIATYSNSTLNDQDQVTCQLSSSDPCASGAPVTSNTVTMSVNANPTPSISGTLSICAGTPTILDAGAGYSSYSWSNSSTTETTSVSSAGSYYVTVTNGNGCTGTSSSVTVTADAPINIQYATANVTGCFGGSNGSVSSEVTGGTSPYTYSWSNAATTASLTNLPAGNYTVTVTDHNGCTSTMKKLIDYWNFDNTLPATGAGLIALNNLTPDYSTTGGAQITFNQITSPNRDSTLDNGSGGAAQNIRSGYAASGSANLYVRTRNPNSEDTLKFYMPTTGYQNIVLSFANEQSSAGKEVLQYAYSTDGGATWDTAGLGAALGSDYYAPPTAFGLETINLSSISGVNNNANFVFAILDTVTIAASGNNRYDNVTLEGDSIVAGNPSIGAVVNQPAALNTTITPSGATTFCSGGSVTLTAPTATGNAYLWYPGNQTSQSITVSASGSYSVTVTNGSCSNTSTATVVTVNSLPTVNANASSTSICAGASETLTGSGAVSYAWTGGVTDDVSFTPSVGTATYTVTGTDVNSCSSTATTTVTVNPIITPLVSIASNTGPGNAISVCSGQSVTFTPTPTNGGDSPSYQWYLNGSSVSTGATYTYTPTTGDQVYCILTSSANCLSTATATSNTVTITVTGSVTPAVSIASGSGNSVCSGVSTTFTAIPTNGGSTPAYAWADNGSPVGTNSATYTTSSLSNGDVITCVMTSSNGCASPTTATSNSLNITVSQSVTASVSIVSNATSNTTCTGTSVTFTATPTNGGTPAYQWKDNGSNVGTNSATYTTTSLNNNDAITCVMTSSLACSNVATSNTVNMTVNANPATPVITGVKTVCSGVATTLDAGAGYTTYLWSNGGATTETISVAGAGSYSVTVTNASGCSASSSTVSVITATAPFVTDSSGNEVCNGGTTGYAVAVVNSGTSPFTYSWSGPNGYTASTASITGLAAGNYSVTVTDHNGCTATNKKLIYYWSFDNTLPLGGAGGVALNNLTPDYSDASAGSAQITFNQITSPSRDSILDNGSGGAIQNLRSGYSSSTHGNNYVRTRNPNNEDTLKFYLPTTGFQNIVLSMVEEASSAGKDVNVFSYSTNGGSTWVTTGLSATTYTAGLTFVTYTIDLRGISTVNNNANFIFAINNSINTTSGNVRYDNVTLEGDAINGSAGSPVIISAPIAASATITPSGATTFCTGGSVTLTAPAGMTTYKWSNNATTQSITVSASGSYTVKDSISGCATTATSAATVVTVNPLPTVVANASNTSICSGTSETLTGSGAVSYAWTGGVTDGVAFTPASTATYTVTGTDANSCSSTATTSVTVTPTVVPSVSISSDAGSGNTVAICTGTTVNFTANPVNGGSSPFYAWTLNGNPVGSNSATYSNGALNNSDVVACTLTSNATCASPTTANSNTITITVSGGVTPSVSIASGSGTTVCAGASVTFTATPTNGGATPSYAWADNGSAVGTNSATYITSSLANGDAITCVMTSSNGCASPSTATSNSLNMTVNATVSASVNIAAAPSGAVCAGTSVTFTATPTNGGTPSYQWSVNGSNVGTNSATYSYTPANSDAVVCNMTSSLACTSLATSNTVNETVNPTPAPSISGTLALACSGNSTTLDAGAGYSTYAWNNNETTEIVSVSVGSYTVTVSNSFGCSASASATVTATNTSPLVTDSSSNGCNGANNGYAVAVVTGGATPYTYAWSNSATTQKITGLSAGSYSVTVTDNHGCTATLKKLIDYWSFDNTTPLGGNGGIALSNLTPDYSTGNNAMITFNKIGIDSILDNGNGGAIQNQRSGYNSSDYGNNYVRTRNPDNLDTLKFYLPTTGYQNILLTFAEEQSSAGKDTNLYSYSIDGINFITTGLAVTKVPAGTTWGIQSINLSSIPTVNNNPNFIFAIRNSYNTTSGNARFDNVTLEGDSIVAGQAGSSVVIINPDPINTTVTGPTQFCAGGYTLLNAPVYFNTYHWSATQGTGSKSLTSTNDTIKTAGTYSVTITDINGCTATSTGTTVSQNTPTAAITGNAPICSGSSETLTASAGSNTATAYAWSPGGATTSTISVGGGGPYTVTITDSYGCTATSSATTVTVNSNVTPSVSIAANTGNAICAGTPVTFTATPTNGGSASYAWTLNGNPVGSNSATYSSSSLADGDVVACTMTSSLTCVTSATASSNSITMSVTTNVTPSVSIAANTGNTICTGTSVTFTATPTNGGSASYAWTLNGNAVGSNSATYSNSGLNDGDVVACTMTSSLTCVTTATASSNSIAMSVSSTMTPSVSIAANPGNSICSGTSVTFTASPSAGGSSPSYAWMLNGNPVGSNSATYSSSSFADGDVIACTMTSSLSCVTSATASSNGITMSVTTSVTPSVSIAANTGNTICAGTSVTFTATPVNGGSASYAWTLNGSPVGSNSATYTNGGLNDGDVVACTLTSSLTCVTSATASSNSITMSVTTNVTPSVSIAANPGSTICAGTSVTFTATPTNGGSASYAWTLNGSAVGTNSATYSNSGLNNGDMVACTLTSSLTCVTSATASSNTVAITVNSLPTVSITGASSICLGATTTLSPTTGGTWTSSNTAFATVTNAGVVTGTGVGSPTFRFTSTSTGCSASTSAITVTNCGTCTTPAPTGSSPQTFCSAAPHTIASLTATVTGTAIKWYSAATGGTALTSTTVLLTGHTYYATQTVGCESPIRLPVAVIITTSPTVAAITGVSAVCMGASITLADVTANGTWGSTAGTGSASVDNNGVVTPITAGSVTISYAVTSGGCTATAYKAITINAIPVASVASSVSPICNNTKTAIILASTTSPTTYSYMASGDPIISGYANGTISPIAQTLKNNGTVQGVATYTITPVSEGCVGSPITASVTVNPVATGSAAPSPLAICSGSTASITLNAGPVSGTVFAWTSAIVGSVTITGQGSCTTNDGSCGASISNILSNSGTANGTVTYSVTPWANGCAGTVFKDVVTVRPVPAAFANPSTSTICSGGTTPILLSSSTSGSTYSYTAAITTAPDGVGTITGLLNGGGTKIAQKLVNSGTTDGVVTYTITPSYDGCLGNPITATVTVHPTPTGSASPSPVAICSGSFTGITLTAGPVLGTTFTWTSLPGATITGTPSSCTSNCTFINDSLYNTGVANATVTYSIVPVANGCAAITAIKDIVTVRPVPFASTIATNTTICSGTKTAIPLTSTTHGSSFSYTASGDAIITGFGSGTTTSLIAQTLLNHGTIAGLVTYTITPSYDGCAGSPITATVTVNPVANGSVSPTTETIDPGTRTNATLVAGSVANTTFAWAYTANGNITGPPSNCTSGCTAITDSLYNVATTRQNLTYTITPWANNCAGTKFTHVVTVLPDPIATGQENVTICSGVKTSIKLTSSTSGATYSYTASLFLGTVTGFSNGSVTPIAQTLSNSGTTIGQVVYAITPNYMGSIGSTIYDTVTVNPVPTGSVSPLSEGICSGSYTGITLTPGAVGGTNFSWSASEISSVSGASTCSDPNGLCGTSINDQLMNTTTLGSVEVYTITPWANGCAGTKITANVMVQSGTPAKPGISGTATRLCKAPVTYTYTATGIAAYNTVSWTLPTGCTLMGGSLTSNQVIVSYASNYTTGTLQVTTTNLCGNTSPVGTLLTSRVGSVCREGDNAPEVDAPATMIMKAYPNPAHDKLNVSFSSDQGVNYELQLVDVTGRVMMNQSNTAQQGNNLVEIDLSNYAEGLYMLSLTTEDGSRQVLRIVVE